MSMRIKHDPLCSHVFCLKMFEPACVCAVVAFNIADHLLDKPEDLHVSELGALSGAEPQKLGRILRLLASRHCFRGGEAFERVLICPSFLHSTCSQPRCLCKQPSQYDACEDE